MADPLAHPTDAAICRLLAGGPLPTAAIAARLAIPERTARYRLARLRQAGSVSTGIDRLHRLAEIAPPDLATADASPPGREPAGAGHPTTGSAAVSTPLAGVQKANASDDRETDRMGRVHPAQLGGSGTVLMVLAVGGIGLLAVVGLWNRPSPPPEPPPTSYAGGWYPGPGW